jgi:hypothetical protein
VKKRGASYRISLINALQGTGLKGLYADVFLDGDALCVEGEGGGVIAIPASDVERIRFFKVEAQQRLGSFCEARIWWKSHQKPLRLSAGISDTGYRAVMHSFAKHIATEGGLNRIYRGESPVAATTMILLTGGSVAALTLLLIVFAIFLGSWWSAIAAVPVGFSAYILLRAMIARYWPRPVESLSEIEQELPTIKERV